jgi:uncharacterized protein YjbI with pentapeptide repeats
MSDDKQQQEQPADAWGQPISEERQAELAAMQAAWDAPGAEHGDRKGPFDGVELIGTDAAWLAERSGRDWHGWVPSLHLERANFGGGAHLEGADLRFAHLEGVTLIGAHLEGARLDQIHLEGANLHGTHLEGAILNGARLERASLMNSHLEGADLRQAHLEETNLDHAHLEGANLESAHLERANLRYADLKRADLDSAHLEGADPIGAHLEGATLNGASFDKVTQLNNATLTGVRLDRATFDNTNLSVVNWREVPVLGDELVARAGKDKYGYWKNRDTRREEYRAAVRANRRLAVALQANGLSEDAARYTYRAQLCQRKALFYERRIPAWLGSWFLAALAGYGFRPGRTILWYLAVVGGFALAYFLFGPSSAVHLTWNEALVVSLTAFHGRGFFATTFQPGDPLAALAAIEAVTGLLIEISFIATFTQRFFNAR